MIPVLGLHSKERKARAHTGICISMVKAALFTATKGGSDPKVHPEMNGYIKYGLYIW